MSIETKNIIMRVCVYSDRAMITREVKLKNLTGEQTYSFSDLTPSLLRDSIRVKGAGEMVLLDNNLCDIALRDTNIEELNRIENEIYRIERELEFVSREIEKLEILISYLNCLNFNEDIADPKDLNFEKASSADYQEFIEYYGKESKAFRNDRLALEVKRRELKKKSKNLYYYADKLKEASGRTSVECCVSFRMKSSGDAYIRLSYVVPSASWSPLYDGRLIYKERQFELVSYAEVTQMTGEDWDNVGLDLSTANPSSGAHLPDPEPWYINLYESPPPIQVPAMRSASVSKKSKRHEDKYPEEEYEDEIEMMEDAAEMSVAEPDMSSEVAEVTDKTFAVSKVKTSGLNVTFACGASQNIPTDGTARKVFITMERFPVEYEYIVMPAIQEAAYLRIIMENTCDYPLLSGPVKVFRDFDYTGDSQIKTIVPGEKLKLYMGTDDCIRVKRELVNQLKGKKGLTGKDTSIEFTYKITIESFKDEKETIKLFERIPVSKNKEIEVKVTKGNDFQEPDEWGIIKKEFDIKPGEKMEFIYSFTVRHPADEEIAGLYRV
ncbi:MAG: mucoidy inhibitor MuiA family protein [Spirochaetota bacterium]|nr:mucoidy inhibitor MuiA family protein [Spirochaetota bacterium]